MLAKIKAFYEKHYKLLMLLPILLLLVWVGVLGFCWYTTGDIVTKDVSLKGGILITVKSDSAININSIQSDISGALNTGVRITELSSVTGGRIGYSFELASGVNKDAAISEIGKSLGGELKQGTYTVEEISPSLGSTFFSSTLKAIAIAFIFMSIVVFATFRKIVPSLAVIFAGVADFVGALAMMNILGISLSTAGVAALLMILGYSVDTDVLLSTKVLKRGDKGIMEQIYSSIKTGLTMQTTTLVVLAVLYLVAPVGTLKTIAVVLLIGVLLDVPNTWLMNAGMMRWYAERKEKNG